MKKTLAFMVSWLARLVVIAGACSASCYGETIRLRSGEHGGFSRIALEPATSSDWTLGRTKDGYELRLSRPDITFDLSKVYRAMPRTRIVDIAPAQQDGALALKVNCLCHARAFITQSGTIVIDIRDGPPASDSLFEEMLGAPDAPSAVSARPDPPAPPAAPVLALQAEPESHSMPTLLWPDKPKQSTLPKPRGTHPEPMPSHVLSDAPSKDRPLDMHLETEGRTIEDLLPILPDPRVAAAEAELLFQLGRAASQGLIEAPITVPQDVAHPKPGRVQGENAPAPPDVVTGPLSHAETSVDRDTLTLPQRSQQTADGAACPSDASFALSDWGDDRPAAEQIADLRQSLVGEFDRPSQESVTALAQLYLFFGFGAESRAVLRAFSPNGDINPFIMDIAAVLDGRIPDAPNTLAGMTDCDTAVALWAFLAHPSPGPATTVDHGAVIRAFSALPQHLRKALGPDLSDRFLLNGATDAARAVRDAIARAPGTAGELVSMIDARISLARGDAASGEALLDKIANSNDPASVEALILTIRSRLDRGEPINTKLADNAAALAFELQDEAAGPVLHQLHILARASLRDYAQAFAGYRRWADTHPTTIQIETARALWASLTEFADDAAFLDAFFVRRAVLDQAHAEPALRLAIAARLVAIGFTDEARQTLGEEASRTERGRQVLAAAALDEYDPSDAEAHVAGLEGSENDLIRAQAQAMKGDHSAAAATFAAAGHPEAAGVEAWRAGDLRTASAIGPGPVRTALADIGLSQADIMGDDRQNPDKPDNTEPTGELAAAQALVETSRNMRAVLGTLLLATDANPGPD